LPIIIDEVSERLWLHNEDRPFTGYGSKTVGCLECLHNQPAPNRVRHRILCGAQTPAISPGVPLAGEETIWKNNKLALRPMGVVASLALAVLGSGAVSHSGLEWDAAYNRHWLRRARRLNISLKLTPCVRLWIIGGLFVGFASRW